MINNIDTPEGKDFRERYASELRKKKVNSSSSSHFRLDEISDELARVKHQAMITRGRGGEQLEFEEISRQILRRITIGSSKTSKGVWINFHVIRSNAILSSFISRSNAALSFCSGAYFKSRSQASNWADMISFLSTQRS